MFDKMDFVFVDDADMIIKPIDCIEGAENWLEGGSVVSLWSSVDSRGVKVSYDASHYFHVYLCKWVVERLFRLGARTHPIFQTMRILENTLPKAQLFSQTTTDSNVVYMYLSNNSGGTTKLVPPKVQEKLQASLTLSRRRPLLYFLTLLHRRFRKVQRQIDNQPRVK